MGRRCRDTAIKEVAEELFLDWHTVKELDKQYMREQLRRAGNPPRGSLASTKSPSPRGISTASWSATWIGPGHLVRRQGPLRSEPGRVLHLAGPGRNAGKIRLAVMDMWRAFRNSTLKEGNAPQAAILYDKFHMLKHLGEAMDKVRKREYARLSGKDRRFIKGQRYTLLSHWGNLKASRAEDLKALFQANRRLHTAYLLKESFDQLWNYDVRAGPGVSSSMVGLLAVATPGAVRKIRQHDRTHWDGIVSYCHSGEQGRLGIRGRRQQQNPRHPTPRLWLSGRGVPPPENPDLHAAKTVKITHPKTRRTLLFGPAKS